MSPWLEFEDKSVEKAVDKAAEQLNIPKEKLKHDVISYGSSGIFGLVGAKKAKIRVNAPPAPSEKVLEEVATHGSGPDARAATAELDDAAEPIHPTPEDEQVPVFSTDPIELGKDVLQRIIDLITTDAKGVTFSPTLIKDTVPLAVNLFGFDPGGHGYLVHIERFMVLDNNPVDFIFCITF